MMASFTVEAESHLAVSGLTNALALAIIFYLFLDDFGIPVPALYVFLLVLCAAQPRALYQLALHDPHCHSVDIELNSVSNFNVYG